jgi:hypothetical protein
VEEELAAGLGERQVAELVEHHELEAEQPVAEPAGPTSPDLGFELVDQIDGVEEAGPGAGADALRRDRDRQMALASAGRSSVILPGVRRPRFVSSIRSIRAAARRWWWLMRSVTRARSTSSFDSLTGPWRCCRRG